ncbi:S25 ribosomal protein [Thecamonas trahens ATCC 50062]|uniref:40S ribosomal protein S25 n=1 Tax=Thecamonas trahens ATCC 50062 TaxID=461836 RepID=A0A0L0D3V2_THETB|nr:S25 ribosomal protein [Thecamonas trahens ATCC 50062]KNC45983.1 S25 ribosomal protein [Thecamonas trahens ATCC 50062]|eukprot:XP_013762964.1 S25 ribosomal protein [Thecamonas trahens ATCC 50062]
MAGAKKKKWSKTRSRDKIENAVFANEEKYAEIMAEVPKYRLITPSIIAERMRVNGSVARAAIKDMLAEGLIIEVSTHRSQSIYTKAVADEVAVAEDGEEEVDMSEFE